MNAVSFCGFLAPNIIILFALVNPFISLTTKTQCTFSVSTDLQRKPYNS